MEYSTQSDVGGQIFTLSGSLTFKDAAKLSEIQGHLRQGDQDKPCVFDLSRVEFIDSSGLGMFLKLRDQVLDQGSEIILRNPQDKVMKVFKACKYEALFTIEN